MNSGAIKGFAILRAPCGPVFRVLVVTAEESFVYLYIVATNYRFGQYDLVTWNDETLYWHSANRVIKFELLQTGVAIQ